MDSKKRDSSIELLRIIAAMAVVILHYNNNGIGGGFNLVLPGSINSAYMFFVENLFVCAVDLFVLVSAYFLSATNKRKFVKVIELLLQVVIFRLLFYFSGVILGSPFSFRELIVALLPSNYFVILYLVLYAISPYINVALRAINKIQRKKLIITFFLVFSVFAFGVDVIETVGRGKTGGLSPIGMQGSQYGYTIVNFVLMYIIGAWIRYEDVSISMSKKIFGIVGCLVVMCLTTYIETLYGFDRITWSYNNPFVIMLAFFVFLLFKNVSFSCRWINELARGAFTCYVFHGDFMLLFGIPWIIEATSSNVFVLILHQLIVALAFYMVSYVIFKVYYLFNKGVTCLVAPICDKIDLSL